MSVNTCGIYLSTHSAIQCPITTNQNFISFNWQQMSDTKTLATSNIVRRKWGQNLERNIPQEIFHCFGLLGWYVFRNQWVPLVYWWTNFVIQDGVQNGCRIWSFSKFVIFGRIFSCNTWFYRFLGIRSSIEMLFLHFELYLQK